MKIFGSVLLTLLMASLSWAHCHEGYGDDILQKRFSGCKGDFLAAAHEDPSLKNTFKGIEEVCMNGCYDAMFNPTLGPDCDKKYTAALSTGSDQFASLAQKYGCTDNKTFGPPTTSGCYWESRVTTDLTCGGERNTNICGGGERSTCSGIVTCPKDFKVGGQALDKGSYTVACLSKSGKCEDISVDECMLDPNTSTYTKETFLKGSGLSIKNGVPRGGNQ